MYVYISIIFLYIHIFSREIIGLFSLRLLTWTQHEIILTNTVNSIIYPCRAAAKSGRGEGGVFWLGGCDQKILLSPTYLLLFLLSVFSLPPSLPMQGFIIQTINSRRELTLRDEVATGESSHQETRYCQERAHTR